VTLTRSRKAGRRKKKTCGFDAAADRVATGKVLITRAAADAVEQKLRHISDPRDAKREALGGERGETPPCFPGIFGSACRILDLLAAKKGSPTWHATSQLK
jgi:hypothetical protein